MTRKVVSLAGDAPLETAAWRLADEAVSGAPVRDARGNLIGVLSKSDLVDSVREKPHARTVQDAMSPAVWAVHPDHAAMDAVKLMLEKNVHRVLVVRGPGQLEGIVTTMDVVRALAHGKSFDPDEPDDPVAREAYLDIGMPEEPDESSRPAVRTSPSSGQQVS